MGRPLTRLCDKPTLGHLLLTSLLSTPRALPFYPLSKKKQAKEKSEEFYPRIKETDCSKFNGIWIKGHWIEVSLMEFESKVLGLT